MREIFLNYPNSKTNYLLNVFTVSVAQIMYIVIRVKFTFYENNTYKYNFRTSRKFNFLDFLL